MKKLAGISLITLLALTGCSYGSSEEASISYFSPSGITPELHQNLTDEEHAALDSNGVSVAAGEERLVILPAVVTDSDGTKKNGDFVQGKHIRMVIDTSAMNYDCVDDQYFLSGTVDVSGTRLSEGYEEGDCGPGIAVFASPTQDTEWDEGREGRGISGIVPQGRSVIEFDAVHDAYLSAILTTHETWVAYSATTGEVTKNTPIEKSDIYPYVLPGTVPTEQEIATMNPQYTNGENTLEVGKVTVTEGDYDRSVLHIPVISNATTPYCTLNTPLYCLTFSIITKKTGSDLVSQSYSSIPEKYKGEITVSTPEFDEAYVELTDGHGTITRINLLTGTSEVIEHSAQ